MRKSDVLGTESERRISVMPELDQPELDQVLLLDE